MGHTEQQHRVTVRRIGPSWQVTCPRCGMTWTRDDQPSAIVKADTHLQHNHPPAPLSIGAWKR